MTASHILCIFLDSPNSYFKSSKLFLPTFKWIISTKGFTTISPILLDWLFLRLRIALTYCSSAVLWICTVFWFQPSPGLKYCLRHLPLRLTMERSCPTQKTEGRGSFCTMWPVFFFVVCFFDQDLVRDIRITPPPQRLGRDLCTLTYNLCLGIEKRAEYVRETARDRWGEMKWIRTN